MMMSDNLKSYVSIYKDFVSKDVRENAIKNLENASWDLHSYEDSLTGQYRSNPYDLSVSYDEVPEKKVIQDSLWNAIHKYISEDHKEVNNWFNSWSGYTEVRFNKYDINTSMDIHCDHIHTMFDGSRKGVPTLTVLGLLNDQFDGGEFVMWGDEVIDFEAGSVIVFPSNFLYPHHVMPIKAGVRYSFVSWVW